MGAAIDLEVSNSFDSYMDDVSSLVNYYGWNFDGR